MEKLESLQRHHAELSDIAKDLDQSLSRLIRDLREEIDVRSGKSAPRVTHDSDLIPMCYGLEWSLVDEPWAVIANAQRMVKLMEQAARDVASGSRGDAIADIPQEAWDEYRTLHGEYMALRDRWRVALKKSQAYWNERIVPYLDAGKD